MKREKKISFTYYANTNLKPEFADYGPEVDESISKAEHYPIYVRVNYNGSNTRFRYIKTTEAGIIMPLSRIDNVATELNEIKTIINHSIGLEKEIEAIVRYEDSISFNKKYSLKGLPSRYSFYDFPLQDFLVKSIIDGLNTYLSSNENTKEGLKFIGSISNGKLSYGFSLIMKHIPSFIEKMPASLKTQIVTLLAIQLFEYSPYNKPKNGSSIKGIIRWFDFKFNGKDDLFLEFLEDWNPEIFSEKHFKSERWVREIIALTQTFPILNSEALSYSNTLENLAFSYLKEYK